MNRLYVVESTPSSTGMKADHRAPVTVSEIARAAVMNDSVLSSYAFTKAFSEDLDSHAGSSVVIVGDHFPS